MSSMPTFLTRRTMSLIAASALIATAPAGAILSATASATDAITIATPTSELTPLRTGAPLTADSVATVNARLAGDPALGGRLSSALSASFGGTMSEIFALTDAQQRAA